MKRLASSLLCIAALALTLAGAGPSRPAGHVVEVGFRSVAISGKLRLAVYLPPGYAGTGPSSSRAPPQPVLGRGVLERVLPPDESAGDAGPRPRLGRAHRAG